MSNAPADRGGRRPGRVRLAIDAMTPVTRQAIESAASLASQGAVQLDCVFVEPMDLFHAASLPLTREFGVRIAAPRPLDRAELERALQSQAGQARRRLAQVAAAMRIEYAFEVARGELLEQALSRCAPQDLLVVGAAGCELELSESPPLRGRGGQRTLLALIESLPADLATLRALMRAMPGASLAVWPAGEAARGSTALEAQLEALERETGSPLRRMPETSGAQPQELAATVARVFSELRPQLLALRQDTLATISAELAWAMRRRAALLVATPRTDLA